MERSRLEEENVIKDVKNLFRFKKLKTEKIETTIKDVRNLEDQKTRRLEKDQKTRTLEKEKKTNKESLDIDITNLFEQGYIRNIFEF